MAGFSEISATALMRLIGTRATPTILDVRIDEDVATHPQLIPTSQRVAHTRIAELTPTLKGKHVVVICQKGLKLSHGTAALLRSSGARAEVLEGGAAGWFAAGLPTIAINKIPVNAPGSLWVTKHRPKIDRIACPWLIRRFIDPEAKVLFVPAREVLSVAERFDGIAFDVPDAPWSHHNDRCTFDHLLSGFGLSTAALERMATIIRGADTNRHDLAPECAGLLAFSVGLSRSFSDDLEQLEGGMLVYDALYRWARDGQGEGHDWQETSR